MVTGIRIRTCVVGVVCTVLGSGVVASAQTLDMAFNPGASAQVRAMAVQPNGQIVVGGDFIMIGNGATTHRLHIARLNADGSVDPAFDPVADTSGGNGHVNALLVQPDGKILVGGFFDTLGGGLRYNIGRLNANGSLDTTFYSETAGEVLALALQPDGKILVGGSFVTLGSGPSGARRFIGRLNPNGSTDTTFNPGASLRVRAIVVQPDGRIVVGGDFTRLGGGEYGTTPRNYIGRLNADGTVDMGFNPGADRGVYALALQPTGKIVVGGTFQMLGGGTGTTQTDYMGRLNADGTVDTSWVSRANAHVLTLAQQADGKLLVGGYFDLLGGGGGLGYSVRYHIGRLNPANGAVDQAFNPGANGYVQAIAPQGDGGVVIGGGFIVAGGGGQGWTSRAFIARIGGAAGGIPTTLDTTFNPGANGDVIAIAVQADGKIVVGGNFTMLGGGSGTTARAYIGRLNADGSVDTGFNPGANGAVKALTVLSNGQILVGGAFTMLGGGGTGTTTRNGIGRLNANGTLDTSFNPGKTGYVNAIAVQGDGKAVVGGAVNFGAGALVIDWLGRLNASGSVDTSYVPGANDIVFTLGLQADGKVVVGGRFSRLGGGGSGVTTRLKIGRLNTTGTIDTGFNPGANSEVYAIAVQADQKILVGGNFQALGGGTGTTTRHFIGRLNADGTVDPTFNPGANAPVIAIAVQSNGQILVAGAFTTLGGGGTGTTQRNRIGRLNADGSLDQDFNPGADWNVTAIAAPATGQVLLGGGFTKLGGGTGTTARNRIGRLTPGTPVLSDASVAVTPSSTQSATVPTAAGAVDLTLAPVTTGGSVAVQAQAADPEVLAPAPAGFRFLARVTFEVTATAVFGGADLCFSYTLEQVTAVHLNEATLRVFHIPTGGTSWVDVTKSLNTGTRKVCGSASHFSPFAIGGQELATYTRYLAEGATSSFLDTRLALLNPGTMATTATLTFARAGTSAVVYAVPVPARTRVTVNPKSIAGMASAEFSTKVESNQPLVVDRTLSWDVASGYGAHAETAVAAPAMTWYLAEGATHSGFSLFYLLQNPNAAEADVRVRYLRPSGAPLEKTYTLPPASRNNIWVNEEAFTGLGTALAATDVSAVIESLNGQPIIVERALYLDLPGQVFGAGHESAGVTEPALEWFLAEGATGDYFDLFVLIANPGDIGAQVDATYLLPSGTVVSKSYSVPANSRFNIWVDGEDARLADTAVSTTIRSTNGVPVIVERALWWPGGYGQWYEAHNSPGATSTGTRWALAEGEVGGTRGVETYILLANTSTTTGTVMVTLLFEDGTSTDRTFTVAGNSRFNVDARAEFPLALNRKFGAIVESLGQAPAQIVVERAMYWSALGQNWAAGTNALATKLP